MTKSILPGVILLFLSTALTGAEAPVTYDRVDISVRSVKEVVNDTLSATMFKELEGSDTDRLAREVNKSIADALALAKQYGEVRVQTLDYRTDPVYRNRVISGWRVRQSIKLKSMNAGVLSSLIGRLQSSLSLGHIGYTVSPEGRAEVETLLIADGIERFRARAELVTRSLGREDYRLVRMGINTSSPPTPRMGQMRAMAAEAAPALEAGTQPLEVRISGTIELKN